MGNLWHRGNVWWIRYYRNGRRYAESSESDLKSVAAALLKKREGDVANGLPVSLRRLKFDDAAADVVNDYKTNGKRSVAEVERRIRLHLKPFFGNRRMMDLSTAEAREFIVKRQKAGASNAEINREMAILKRAFTLAVKANTLAFRPHLPMLEENNVRTGFFEKEEFEAVRKHLPEALRPIVTFAYLTGWRIQSEILTLQWRQIDRDRGVVRLDPGSTKNRAGRVLPYGDLLPELRNLIDAQWTATKAVEKSAEKVCPWVFHRNGEPVKGFRKSWENATEAGGCPTRIPHDLRRTAVRNLVRAGVPDKVAMMLTGHKTRSVFDRYDIVDEADLQDGLRKLAEAGATPASGRAKAGKVHRFKKSAS